MSFSPFLWRTTTTAEEWKTTTKNTRQILHIVLLTILSIVSFLPIFLLLQNFIDFCSWLPVLLHCQAFLFQFLRPTNVRFACICLVCKQRSFILLFFKCKQLLYFGFADTINVMKCKQLGIWLESTEKERGHMCDLCVLYKVTSIFACWWVTYWGITAWIVCCISFLVDILKSFLHKTNGYSKHKFLKLCIQDYVNSIL